MCTNTDGSFECSCGTGYSLSSDSLSCDGKKGSLCQVKQYQIISSTIHQLPDFPFLKDTTEEVAS